MEGSRGWVSPGRWCLRMGSAGWLVAAGSRPVSAVLLLVRGEADAMEGTEKLLMRLMLEGTMRVVMLRLEMVRNNHPSGSPWFGERNKGRKGRYR